MTLKDEIDSARKIVRTDKLQMSVGEITSMYENQELNIQPDFQRLFRWPSEKKSNLIESILIDIPIPPIFVYENEDGTWELVDGLQRVSTIFEFLGVLKDLETKNLMLPSVLNKATYLPSLENVVWQQHEGITQIDFNDQRPLEKPQQLAVRRARLDVQVLKQPSDAATKFHLFQRLNRGGAQANEQEVRTCAMVMVAADYVKTIKHLASSNEFRKITSISGDAINRQKDVEYVVRSLVHTYRDYDNKSDVEEFLDSSIIHILQYEDFTDFEKFFTYTVNKLYSLFGDKALFPNAGIDASQGSRFSLRALETVFVGILRNIKAIQALEDPEKYIKSRVLDFWKQPEIEGMSVGGLRGTQRLQRTIPFGTNWFNPKNN